MRDKAKLIKHIQTSIKEPYKSALVKEVKPSIRLKTTGKACPEIGKTKLGGCPDLPANINWPKSKYDDLPMSFLGQLNLAEISAYDELEQLPKEGILYFFFDVGSADEGTVIYSTESDLARKSFPPDFFPPKKSFFQRILTGKNRERKLKESAVEIGKEYHVPSCDSLYMDRIQKITSTEIDPFNATAEDEIHDIYDEGEHETTSNHHVLGHYMGIQNEYIESSFLEGGFEDYENVKLSELDEALKWKLLFQVDSDDHLAMSWGDWGRVFFFIYENDLQNQDFTNVKLMVDCY